MQMTEQRTEVQIGKTYNVTLKDGDIITGTYKGSERGYSIFVDESGKSIPVSWQYLSRVIEICPCCLCTPCDCH